MNDGKGAERPLSKLQEDAELDPEFQALQLQQKPDRQRLSLDALGAVSEEEHQDEEVQRLLQKAKDFADNPHTDYDGFTDPKTKEDHKKADLLVYGRPRTEVAQELEHNMAHDSDLLALKAEIYKKYGQQVYEYAFKKGIPGETRYGNSHEDDLQEWYVEGKDNLIKRIRSIAEYTYKGVLKERETRAQRFKGRVFDALRGLIPDRYALDVMNIQSRKRRKQ